MASGAPHRGVLLPTDENETVTDFSFSPLSPPPLGFLSYDVEAGLDPDGASRVAVAAVAETRAIVLPLKKTLARGHGGVVELTAGVSMDAAEPLLLVLVVRNLPFPISVVLARVCCPMVEQQVAHARDVLCIVPAQEIPQWAF